MFAKKKFVILMLSVAIASSSLVAISKKDLEKRQKIATGVAVGSTLGNIALKGPKAPINVIRNIARLTNAISSSALEDELDIIKIDRIINRLFLAKRDLLTSQWSDNEKIVALAVVLSGITQGVLEKGINVFVKKSFSGTKSRRTCRALLNSLVEASTIIASNEFLIDKGLISLEYTQFRRVVDVNGMNININFADREERIPFLLSSFFMERLLGNAFLELAGAWLSNKIEDEQTKVTSQDIKSFQVLKDEFTAL